MNPIDIVHLTRSSKSIYRLVSPFDLLLLAQLNNQLRKEMNKRSYFENRPDKGNAALNLLLKMIFVGLIIGLTIINHQDGVRIKQHNEYRHILRSYLDILIQLGSTNYGDLRCCEFTNPHTCGPDYIKEYSPVNCTSPIIPFRDASPHYIENYPPCESLCMELSANQLKVNQWQYEIINKHWKSEVGIISAIIIPAIIIFCVLTYRKENQPTNFFAIGKERFDEMPLNQLSNEFQSLAKLVFSQDKHFNDLSLDSTVSLLKEKPNSGKYRLNRFHDGIYSALKKQRILIPLIVQRT